MSKFIILKTGRKKITGLSQMFCRKNDNTRKEITVVILNQWDWNTYKKDETVELTDVLAFEYACMCVCVCMCVYVLQHHVNY